MRNPQKNQLAFSNRKFYLSTFLRKHPFFLLWQITIKDRDSTVRLRSITIFDRDLPSSTTTKFFCTQNLLVSNTNIRVPFTTKRYEVTTYYYLCDAKNRKTYRKHVFLASLSTSLQNKSCNIVQLVNTIRQNISNQKLLTSETELLVTFSGGQDSICSLFVLFLIQNQINISFDSIFMNHFWQKSSFFTMLHATRCGFCFCCTMKLFIPLNTVTTHQIHSEQKARNWRHCATQRAAIFYGYAVWTQGHSKSDRVETILFNLIRGAGMPGVSALHWKKTQKTFFSNKYYPNLFNFVEQTHFHLT